MSAALVLSIALIAAVWGLLVYQRRVDAQRREGFSEFVSMAEAASQRKSRQPDMASASKAFAAIALVRANNVNVDLHALEMAQAEAVLKSGGTEEQALSARWGGVYGIDADLDLFQSGVLAYEETRREMARGPTDEDPKTKFYASATLYLSRMLAENPDEYERFLRYINR